MMVMTAKVDMKKIVLVLGIIVAGIIGLLLLFGGNTQSQTTAAAVATNNDARVKFLKDFGWDIASSPVESSQVRIPDKTTEVFDRYNQLQKSQGYDLGKLAGKNAMRYVYKVNNYPGATEPVYATVLIYKNEIVGGDITDTSARGKVQGFKMPQTASTVPSESSPIT